MMPCCSLKDAPSVTVRTHLPQKQQTMVTETIDALVQWQRRKHMGNCKYSTVKSKGQFLQWGPVSSAMPPRSLLFNLNRNFEASFITDKEFSKCHTADLIC